MDEKPDRHWQAGHKQDTSGRQHLASTAMSPSKWWSRNHQSEPDNCSECKQRSKQTQVWSQPQLLIPLWPFPTINNAQSLLHLFNQLVKTDCWYQQQKFTSLLTVQSQEPWPWSQFQESQITLFHVSESRKLQWPIVSGHKHTKRFS